MAACGTETRGLGPDPGVLQIASSQCLSWGAELTLPRVMMLLDGNKPWIFAQGCGCCWQTACSRMIPQRSGTC